MLTEEQSKLVSENHNLIFFVLGHRIFDEKQFDDYYGDAAIGLCKAAASFDPKKGEFSTHAYHVIMNEINMQSRRNRRWEQNGELLSLNCLFESDDRKDAEFEEFFRSNDNIEEICITRGIFDEIPHIINQREQEIMKMLYMGKKQSEIAKHFQVSQGTISKTINRLKKKIDNAIEKGIITYEN